MRSVSVKRRRDFVARAAVKAACHERDDWTCRARDLVPQVACWMPEGCGWLLDCHEIIPRSVWPDGWLNLDNTISVCRAHHEWIDNYPYFAHALGLHGHAWERPDLSADINQGEET